MGVDAGIVLYLGWEWRELLNLPPSPNPFPLHPTDLQGEGETRLEI